MPASSPDRRSARTAASSSCRDTLRSNNRRARKIRGAGCFALGAAPRLRHHFSRHATQDRHHHRIYGDPAVVAAGPVHGWIGAGAAVSSQRDLLCDRRHDRPRLDPAVGGAGTTAWRGMEGLCLRHGRALWLSLPLFLGVADGACRRGGADRLSLAAVHRAAVGPAAGRASGAASCDRGVAGLRGGGADRDAWRRRDDGGGSAGAWPRVSLRTDLGGLFGAVAAAGRCADRERGGVLPVHGRAFTWRTSDARSDGVARLRPRLAFGCGAGGGAGRHRLLHLGRRDEEG